MIPEQAQKAVQTAGTEEGVVMVCFRAGPYRVAVEPRHVLSSHPVGAGDGEFDAPTVEARLGLPVLPDQPRQILNLNQPTPTRLTVSPPVELRRFPCSAIHPLPPLIAACCRVPGLKGLALDSNGVVLFVDPDPNETH